MPSIYANPYDTSAHGFYFENYQDFMNKYRNNVNRFGAPVEEYSFEFISGDDAEQALFMAMEDNGFIDLQEYFQLLNNVDQHQVPALVYLMDVMGLDAERAMANVDDVVVIEDDAITYISEYFIPEMFYDDTTYSNLHPMLIDFKALGRDFEINHPEIRDLGYAPYDAGMYVYENWLENDLGNVSAYDISPDYYLDEQALLRDMMNAQQIDEFRIMGKTYTIANKDDVQNMRNNPAICKDGTVSSSGMPSKMGQKWQQSYSDPQHTRGVCTKHGGVDQIISESKYKKFKPKQLKEYGQDGDDGFVTYRHERHPSVSKAIKAMKKKKAKAKKKK